MEIKTKIDDTIFADYSTVVFDLDGTLLDVFSPQGDSIGCYETNPPYTLKNMNVVTDVDGNIVKLDDGVRDLFKWLDKNDVNIGIVSSGEKKDTTPEAQPGVILLKKFDLKKYVNYEIVLKRDINKADYVKPLGKTLFIDNKDENLDDVDKKGQVDVLNRGSFENWADLMQHKSSALNLIFLKLGSFEEPDPVNSAIHFYKDTLDYSKLRLKQNCSEYLTDKEKRKLFSLRRDLPRNMLTLSNTLQHKWRSVDLKAVSSLVWNEDNWPECFRYIDNAIDYVGL
jgi:predicted phosphatase